MRKVCESPSLEELKGIITWEEGTVGYAEEKEALRLLLYLCIKHGFGRIPQMAEEIKNVWYDPSYPEKLQESRQEHLEMMRSLKAKVGRIEEKKAKSHS